MTTSPRLTPSPPHTDTRTGYATTDTPPTHNKKDLPAPSPRPGAAGAWRQPAHRRAGRARPEIGPAPRVRLHSAAVAVWGMWETDPCPNRAIQGRIWLWETCQRERWPARRKPARTCAWLAWFSIGLCGRLRRFSIISTPTIGGARLPPGHAGVIGPRAGIEGRPIGGGGRGSALARAAIAGGQRGSLRPPFKAPTPLSASAGRGDVCL